MNVVAQQFYQEWKSEYFMTCAGISTIHELLRKGITEPGVQ